MHVAGVAAAAHVCHQFQRPSQLLGLAHEGHSGGEGVHVCQAAERVVGLQGAQPLEDV